MEEASEAQLQGKKAENVDLAQFVVNAARIDGGELLEGDTTKPVFTLRIPNAWTFGLDQIPGYDSSRKLIRLTTPEQRLAAFAADRSQPTSKRSEADGVLRLYRQRSQVLDVLFDLRDPEVIPLGVLMLIPEATHAS